MTDPLVTYPSGSTSESSVVLAVTRVDGEVLFAVERTPCHPESPRWPDQPADRCWIEGLQIGPSAANPIRPLGSNPPHPSDANPPHPSGRTPVECLEGWLRGGEVALGRAPEDPDLPNGPDSAGAVQAIPCVVHRAPENLGIAVGDRVWLGVDERYREALSRSHTRCHLVSLALNAALAGAWRKDPPARDSLGNPDFDKLAIVSSRIDERGSLDCYRVGRHVRKAGFSVAALGDARALAEEVEGIARGWLLSSLETSVTPGCCRLQERRTWSCALPGGTASFPCGGTHIRLMEPGEELAVAISWDPEERRLQMRAEGGPSDV